MKLQVFGERCVLGHIYKLFDLLGEGKVWALAFISNKIKLFLLRLLSSGKYYGPSTIDLCLDDWSKFH
jgi:hypothetical protein